MTTQDDIRGWLDEGKKQKASHMIVVCNTFDWEDYPVYVLTGTNVNAKIDEYRKKGMQKIMEVYKLSDDLEEQIAEHRTYRI